MNAPALNDLRVLLTVATVTLAACSANTHAATTSPPPPVAALEAGAAWPAGSHAADDGGDGGCASTLSIQGSAPIRLVRDHHTTLVIEVGAGALVYVMGGTDAWATIYDDILRAPSTETARSVPSSR